MTAAPTFLIDGARLRDARRKRQLAQVELAQLVKRDQATVSRWERGETRLDAATVDALARALHVRRRNLVVTARCAWCGMKAYETDRLIVVGSYGMAHGRGCAEALDAALSEGAL